MPKEQSSSAIYGFYSEMAKTLGVETALARLQGAKRAYKNSWVKDPQILQIYTRLEQVFKQHLASQRQ